MVCYYKRVNKGRRDFCYCEDNEVSFGNNTILSILYRILGFYVKLNVLLQASHKLLISCCFLVISYTLDNISKHSIS